MDDFKTNNKDSDEYYDRRSKNMDEKFCDSCGSIIKKEAELCVKCGVTQDLTRGGQASAHLAQQNQSKSGMGIASMVIGIVSVVFAFIPFCGVIAIIPAIVGLVLGIISFLKYKREGSSKGHSIAGIVLNGVALLPVFYFIMVWIYLVAGINAAI